MTRRTASAIWFWTWFSLAWSPFLFGTLMLHSAACEQNNRDVDRWARHGYPEGDQSNLTYRYCRIVRQPFTWMFP